MLNLSTDPKAVHTIWAGLVGGVALTLATHGTDQFLVQRLLSARSAREASVGLVLSGVIVFAQFALFLVIGVMLFTYYQHVPAPALGRPDEILPRFVVDTLTGGAAGFIVAAIVAAALSPSLNAMAAVTVKDFYVKFVRPDATEPQMMRLARQSHHCVGPGADWRRACRAVDGSVGARCRPRGPLAGRRSRARRVPGRRVHDARAARAMLIGMAAGAGVLVWIWWTGAVAWTWYAFIGATVTSAFSLWAAYVDRHVE